MTSAQVVETSVNVNTNIHSQHYSHPNDHATLTKASPRISNPMENNFLVPCPEIMGTHL